MVPTRRRQSDKQKATGYACQAQPDCCRKARTARPAVRRLRCRDQGFRCASHRRRALLGFRIPGWRRPRIGDQAHDARPHRGPALPGRAKPQRRSTIAHAWARTLPAPATTHAVLSTVAALSSATLREEVAPTLKPRTASSIAGYFANHVLPALGAKRARNVTFSDIAKMHRAIGADAKVAANRIVALVSSLYGWAAKAGEVPRGTNPRAT